MKYDAIVAGGGHNGLVCAAVLARAGRRVVVVERRDRTGGILDGVVSTVGRLRPNLVAELELERHGLELVRPPVRMLALRDDGPPIAFFTDPARTAAGHGTGACVSRDVTRRRVAGTAGGTGPCRRNRRTRQRDLQGRATRCTA